MCCFTVGAAAWRCKALDVGGDRDGLNVFELLVTRTFTPEKKMLLNRPVVGGSCVRVADRDRKELEEFFPS